MKKSELRELIKEIILQEIEIKKRTPEDIKDEEELLQKIADFKKKHPDFQYASDETVKAGFRKPGGNYKELTYFDKARVAYAKDKADKRERGS
jgi:hypothetical protein